MTKIFCYHRKFELKIKKSSVIKNNIMIKSYMVRLYVHSLIKLDFNSLASLIYENQCII